MLIHRLNKEERTTGNGSCMTVASRDYGFLVMMVFSLAAAVITQTVPSLSWTASDGSPHFLAALTVCLVCSLGQVVTLFLAMRPPAAVSSILGFFVLSLGLYLLAVGIYPYFPAVKYSAAVTWPMLMTTLGHAVWYVIASAVYPVAVFIRERLTLVTA